MKDVYVVYFLILVIGYFILNLSSKSWAPACLWVSAVVLLDANLRVKASTGFDEQVALKILLCVGLGWYAVSRAQLFACAVAKFSPSWVLLMLYLFVEGVSCLWSMDSLNGISAICLTIMALLGTRRFLVAKGLEQVLEYFFVGIIIKIYFSLLYVLLFPDIAWFLDSDGTDQLLRLAGISHPVVIGRCSAIYILYLLVRFFRRDPFSVVYVANGGAACLSFYLAHSKGGMGTLIAGFVIVLLYYNRKRIFMYIVLGAFSLCVLLMLGITGVSVLDRGARLLARSGDASEVTSLTGRDRIWEGVVHYADQRPLFGWGFMSGPVICKKYLGYDHAHNSFLATYLDNGYVGVGLLLILVVLAILNAIRIRRMLVFLSVLVIVFAMVSETIPLNGLPTCFSILLFICYWTQVEETQLRCGGGKPDKGLI